MAGRRRGTGVAGPSRPRSREAGVAANPADATPVARRYAPFDIVVVVRCPSDVPEGEERRC